jgi:hypothetical protein
MRYESSFCVPVGFGNTIEIQLYHVLSNPGLTVTSHQPLSICHCMGLCGEFLPSQAKELACEAVD